MHLSMKTAVIYCRTATSENDTALKEQLHTCSTYCAENGFAVVGTYCEAGVSGLWAERPEELTKAVACIVGGEAEYLVCTDLNRISRDANTLHDVLAMVSRYGGEMRTCNGAPGSVAALIGGTNE